ncbi:hypothetical protein [Streptomyces sp. NPDC059616]|uniref:hypothetical protein n=1 Tax=Streptomyces sp. NPDC059616 TaxID=3346886 RepID=UPI00368DD7D7
MAPTFETSDDMTGPHRSEASRPLNLKSKLSAPALVLSLALATLTGCSMADSNNSDDIPLSGTSTSLAAADKMEQVSSGLYDLIGVKGKASDSRPGVTECSGRDQEKYFQIFHPWSFYPASANDLDEAMKQLKAELPKHGWKVVDYGPDTSKNKNINLTADNDKKKYSVKVVQMAKNDPPKLSLMVVSGCYQVPDGEKIQRF